MMGAIAAPMQGSGVSVDPAARAGRRPLSASACEPSICAARSGADAKAEVGRVVATLAASGHLHLAGLMATHDAAETLNAFVAKRPTRWEDR